MEEGLTQGGKWCFGMDILPGRILFLWIPWDLGRATYASIELRVYHLTGVQAGLTRSSDDIDGDTAEAATDGDTAEAAAPSAPCGAAGSGGDGGPCFIATAASGS